MKYLMTCFQPTDQMQAVQTPTGIGEFLRRSFGLPRGARCAGWIFRRRLKPPIPVRWHCRRTFPCKPPSHPIRTGGASAERLRLRPHGQHNVGGSRSQFRIRRIRLQRRPRAIDMCAAHSYRRSGIPVHPEEETKLNRTKATLYPPSFGASEKSLRYSDEIASSSLGARRLTRQPMPPKSLEIVDLATVANEQNLNGQVWLIDTINDGIVAYSNPVTVVAA